MSPRRRRSAEPGSLVLDNEGLSRAATDRAMYIRLKAAHLDGRRGVTSAAILAGSLRGGPRDAGIHRVLGGVAVAPVTADLGARAGELIGAAKLGSAHTVDAMVAATALAEPGPVVVVTSDLDDLTALIGKADDISVVHVDRLGH